MLELLVHHCGMLDSIIGTFISCISCTSLLSISLLISSWRPLRVVSFVRMQIELFGASVNFTIIDDLPDDLTDIRLVRKSLKEDRNSA